MNQSNIPPSESHCPGRCGSKSIGRNIAIFFDGTSLYHGGHKISNVILLSSFAVRGRNQYCRYVDGIGHSRSTDGWRKKMSSLHNRAVASNFDHQVKQAYRWLCKTFKAGDRIFLYGFSRGAYQARTLAAMIHEIGVLLNITDSEETLDRAYQAYLSGGNSVRSWNLMSSTTMVEVHFLGLWDTVSSIGIGRQQRPGTDKLGQHVCYIRHALALDECRVKFLPEFFQRTKSKPKNNEPEHQQGSDPLQEVWFPGSHSDVGGTTEVPVNNSETDETRILSKKQHPFGAAALSWMLTQSAEFGLKLKFENELKPSKEKIRIKDLEEVQPTKSLKGLHHVLEWVPLAYSEDVGKNIWGFHRGKGRNLQQDQLLHGSLSHLTKGYRPKAKSRLFRWADDIGKVEATEPGYLDASVSFCPKTLRVSENGVETKRL